MRNAIRVMLRPLMQQWSLGVIRGLDNGPMPTDDPRVHASGADSDRVLLFGSGAAVGWGVLSHSLALPGSLARALTSITGRGTDVEAIAGSRYTAANALDLLANVAIGRFDAVILTLGLNEVTRLSSPDEWRDGFDRLLDRVVAELAPGARIYVLGVHAPTVLSPYDSLVAPFLESQREEINAITAELCAAGDRAMFVDSGPARESGSNRSRRASDYRAGAGILAAIVAPGLDRRFLIADGADRVGDESARQAALDALHIVDTEPDERFDRIVGLARSAFGTEFAALTIIDHDRQWVKSSVGNVEKEVPRHLSICATTIEQPAELIVADIQEDPRFSSAAQAQGDEPVRFYAGFPIEAPGGERVGALCVFDPESRDPIDVDRVLLRDLALMVQDELWLTAS